MSNYIVTETELTAIADTIREKRGTSAPIPFTDFADEIEAITTEADLYEKHLPIELNSFSGIPNTIFDIYVDDTNIVAVNNHSYSSLIIVDKATKSSTVLVPVPTGADATDLPSDMTEFYEGGSGISCRSITATDSHYVIGLRYASGVQVDGTHLYGGVVFINKLTKTVDKSYWLPYIVSRVVYDKDSNILAVACQMAGISFYSVEGTVITKLAQFTYSQASGSPKKGRESQFGCFYRANGHVYYANTGFGVGVLFYDVTDTENITEIGEFTFKAHYPSLSGNVHTYTNIVDYPYMYLTVAPDDKTQALPQYTGVLTVDISDMSNFVVTDFETISSEDALVWNEFGDTKPTEMKRSHGVLYLNYENGILIYEIDNFGKKTHYCGKYLTNRIYGIGTEPSGKFYLPITENDVTGIKQFESSVEWNVSYSLDHVSVSNHATQVAHGQSYTTTISAEELYELDSIAVTMSGTDITATAVSGNVVSVSEVTGDIVITAIASPNVTVYWKPSDGTINQYSGTKPCTLNVDGDDISMSMQANSGFKTTVQLAESPASNLTLRLKADTATVSEPTSAHSVIFQVKFKDSQGTALKTLGYMDSTSSEYVEDVATGISKTFALTAITGATQLEVVCRCANSSDASLFPVNVAFTNLRLEVMP